MRNVCKTYISEHKTNEVVRDVSLDVAENEFVVLFGPGQCGKTTMINLIAGLQLPTSGEVVVDGKKVTMLEDNGSANAEAPLTVVNTRGFDLPKTGDNGTMMITLAGVLLMAGSVTVLLILNQKKFR